MKVTLKELAARAEAVNMEVTYDSNNLYMKSGLNFVNPHELLVEILGLEALANEGKATVSTT